MTYAGSGLACTDGRLPRGRQVLTVEDSVRLMVAVRQALTLHARRLQAHQQAAGRRRHSAAAATAGSDKENSTAGGTEFGQLGRETYSVERFL